MWGKQTSRSNPFGLSPFSFGKTWEQDELSKFCYNFSPEKVFAFKKYI